MYSPHTLFVTLILVAFLGKAFTTVSSKLKINKEKKTSFECGFNSINKTKTAFSTQFILIMILFLIFDLEIMVLIPSIFNENILKTSSMMAFLFMTLVSLATLMEWSNGMVEWTK